jgi:hypothetical protein
VPKRSKAEVAAQIAVLQAELDEQDGGVYEDPRSGRWFIVLRPPGRTRTTTRRRAPDGSRLRTREQALFAKGRWEAEMAGGSVAIGRERFDSYWPRYLRHAKGDMTQGSWEDVRSHGAKRLLPYFGDMQMSNIGAATVRDWRATMVEAVEAGEGAQDDQQRPDRAARMLPDGGRGWPHDAQPGARRQAAADRVHRAPVPAAGADQRLPRRLRASLPAAGGTPDRHRRPRLGGDRARCRRRRRHRRHSARPQATRPRRVPRRSPDQGPEFPHRRHRAWPGHDVARHAGGARRARQRHEMAVPVPACPARPLRRSRRGWPATLGEPVTFRVAAERQFRERLLGSGVPAGTAELLITREWAILAGENDYTSETFRQITGRPPRPVAEFLHEYRAEFI